MAGFTSETAATIVARDRGCCARCGAAVAQGSRGRDWAIHHRAPRGRGGTRRAWVNMPGNGVVLCTACHEWIESHREEARTAGFLVSAIGVQVSADVAIRHALHGLVYLNDWGGVDRLEEGPTPESLGWPS